MLISLRYAFAFIHNPKTGGSAVTQRLCRLARLLPDHLADMNLHPHMTTADLREVVGGDLFARLFTFGFVRNPWDREYSLYRYMLQTPEHWQHEEVARCGSFEGYVAWCRDTQERRNLGDADPWLDEQSSFFYDARGERLASFIGRYENLAEDFAAVVRRIGIRGSATLPRVNQSTHGEYRLFYTARLVDAVARMRSKDIARFGYAFE